MRRRLIDLGLLWNRARSLRAFVPYSPVFYVCCGLDAFLLGWALHAGYWLLISATAAGLAGWFYAGELHNRLSRQMATNERLGQLLAKQMGVEGEVIEVFFPEDGPAADGPAAG